MRTWCEYSVNNWGARVATTTFPHVRYAASLSKDVLDHKINLLLITTGALALNIFITVPNHFLY